MDVGKLQTRKADEVENGSDGGIGEDLAALEGIGVAGADGGRLAGDRGKRT